jgi:cell division protein FtsQ
VDREAPEAPPDALRHGLKLAILWSVLAVVALGAATAGWRALIAGDLLGIRAVRMSPLARATEAELLALSPVKPGDNLLAADVEAMERALARHPWVLEARVHRRLPPALEVKVVERTPRALVDLGGLYLVDADAQVFKRAAAGDGLDLPVVTGFGRDDYVQRRASVEPQLRGALALLDSYAREGLPALAPVSEIHLDADEGLVLYVGDDGMQVRLGQGDLPQKLARLRRVLEALRADGRRAEVVHLDDRGHPDRVAVRIVGRSGGTAIGGEGAGVRPAPSKAEGAREGPGKRRGREAPLARR